MYIALKPCNFAGQKFLSGEVVPAELVSPTAVDRLKRTRILAESEQKETVMVTKTEAETKPLFAVPILAEEGTLSVELPAEDLEKLFVVLQENANKAGAVIADQTNKDLLLCIHALDSRKTVQNAAKERATALMEEKPENAEENEAAESPVTDEPEQA